MRLLVISALLVLVAAACQPAAIVAPEMPSTELAQAATLPPVTAVPTAHLAPSATATLPPTETSTPTPTLTSTPTASPTLTPSATFTATLTLTPSATLTATATPTATVTPTLVTTSTRGPTLTPPAADAVTTLQDHYYMARPLSDNAINYAARTYPYGATAGGRLQVHHGQDMENNSGTPVLAAADGSVIHAGDDLMTLVGPYNNFYGNVVIIEHSFRDASGGAVYSLYGHLSRVEAIAGQGVKRGDTIGYVGASGIAMGSHLHFEVRVGNPFDYQATRNPDLWIFPYFGFGTLAGRVTDSAGNLLYDVTLSVVNDAATRYTFSYADTTVNGDSAFGENWTLGDLPEGYYTVRVSENGRVRFAQEVFVYANKTTWVDVILNP